MAFSLFQKSKRPEDSVTINVQLDQSPDAPFYPTSNVSGQVLLQSALPVAVESITINFFGHVKTAFSRSKSSGTGDNKSSKTIVYRDDANLFLYPSTLAWNVTLDSKVSPWRFQFAFPSATQNYHSEYTKETARTNVWTDAPHELPPSFSEARGFSAECKVEYGLDVFVKFPGVEEPLVRGIVLGFVPFSASLRYVHFPC
jgi:hypothetical protein